MTSILLHEYVEQVEKLIDANRLVEAIEHCLHILHHYPRHIATYRVMGKALLEKQEYDAAADLFLRILGADPNDFISHVGLSIIYKEESQFDQALWHLERAYEIQPYNVAIQGELRQLYAVETETRPGIIPLTRGALSRLYMKGELYQQAILELRRILAEEPDRMDLQVLLAEALWRDDHRIDAEEVCLSILDELPNCIVLNAILAGIWLQTGRIPEAQKYLHRLHTLTWETQKSVDKESIAGRAFTTEGAFTLPEEAPLDFLQTGTVIPEKPATPTDDWVKEISFDNEADDQDALGPVVLEPESGMHSYDWLADIENESVDSAESEQVPSETDWFSQKSAKAALNLSTSELNAEWLADLRGEESVEEESDFQPLELGSQPGLELSSDETDWFSEEEELTADLFGELEDTAVATSSQEATGDTDAEHDWLKDLVEAQEASPAEVGDTPSIQIDATSLMDDKLMDWAEVESDPRIVREPKTPFWLSEMDAGELDAVQLDPEDALDWLAEEPAVSDVDNALDLPEVATALSDIDLESEESLDWLSEVPGEPFNGEDLLDENEEAGESSLGSTAVLEPEEKIQAPETLILTDTSDLGEANDWLAALTEGNIEEEISWDDEIQPEKPADEILIEASTDELAALSDADDWLQSAAADLDAILNEVDLEDEDEFPNLALPDMEGAEITDIPDWLHTDPLDPSVEAETAMSSENDPQEKPQSEDPKVNPVDPVEEEAELSALDWLNELTSDDNETESDAPSEPPIATEGMPSWLDNAKPESGVEVVDEWDSQSADIPDWLQEPVELSELDDDALFDAEEEPEALGLTGLLSEMDMTDEALPLDDMDSLLSDWIDEDADGSLTELLGEFETVDQGAETRSDGPDFADFEEESTAATAVPAPAEEPEEMGLTGLLSNLTLEDETTDTEEPAADDFLSDLFADSDDDDLSEFLWDDEPAVETNDAALGLDDLDLEDVSLTGMLSGMTVEEEPDLMAGAEVLDADDWLSDLSDASDEDALPEPDEFEEAEPEMGLTGMLANLWADDDADFDEEALPETAVTSAEDLNLEETAADELGLTELLAGINYADDVIDSRPELPEIDDPVEPSLTEILYGMDMAPEDEAEVDAAGPISAEDTTWLAQLEADTGSLQEQADDFNMAEETGLDWLTLPDELEEALEKEVTPEVAEASADGDVIVEQDSTPEDWDDAMSWLEELAAQQEDPVEELPSVAETMLDEELDTSEALKMTAPVDSNNMDWLDDLTSEGEAEADEPIESELEVMDALPEDQFTDESVGEVESDLVDDLLDDLEAEGEMSWLDELATDRLGDPAVDDAEIPSEPDEPEALDADDSVWLDELGAEDDLLLAADDLFGADFDELSALDELETAVDDSDLGWLDSVIDDSVIDDIDEEEMETLDADSPEMEALAIVEDGIDPNEAYRVTGVTDALKEDDGLQEAEADLEEALAWLDELDEELEIEPLDEAPPTLVTPPEPHDLPQDVEDDEPETVVLAPEPDELTLALNRLEQQVKDEGIHVPDTAVFPILLSDEELNAALDWIEEVEIADEAELETAVPVGDDELIDELMLDTTSPMDDDPEAWLEELLGSDTAIDVDMEPPPIKPSEDALFVTDDSAVADEPESQDLAAAGDADQGLDTVDSLLNDVEFEGMPDDPDAAVAWLNQMISDDDVLDFEMDSTSLEVNEDAVDVAEEVGSFEVEAVEAELEIVDAVEDDSGSAEEDAEAWLEQMLSGEMTLDIDMEPPPIKPSEDAVFVTEDVPQVEPAPEDVPDDPEPEPAEPIAIVEVDEALQDEIEEDDLSFGDIEDDPEAWLEQMLSGEIALDVDMEPPPIKPSEDAVFVTDDGRSDSEDDTAEFSQIDSAEDIIADVPDDPDEAMAWLEQLAARQGADLAELPSVTDATAELEMPAWMAEDLQELESEPDIEQDEAFGETVKLNESLVDAEPFVDGDVDSELPDWLDSSDDRPIVGETDWLRSLPEVDMDSWLSAEEEATTIEPVEAVHLPDTGPLRSRPAIEPELPLEDDLFEPVIEPSSGAYSVDEAKLDVAQAALADGRLNEAIAQFKELVSAGSGMMAIIAELEQAADSHPQTPALFQVLGDAYMRNGQLQKALVSYRSALDQM